MPRQIITRQNTWAATFMNCFYLAFAAWIGYFLLVRYVSMFAFLVLTVPLAGACLAVWAYRHIAVQRFLNSHDARLAAYIAGNAGELRAGSPADLTQSGTLALYDLHNVRNPGFTNFVKSDDWLYCEYHYNIYRRTKRGEYLAATVYYSVMQAQLPRALPNVFFDSKRARGRQFRFVFAGDQNYRLEGDFNSYFATYFPEQYHIDSLSFITPDTMLALIAAADYDIEISGDRVYLYGPLGDPERTIPDMAAKLAVIRKELLDNILTYRDERLPYAQGRHSVAPIGASLKRSRFWTYVSIGLFAAYILIRMLLEIKSN